MDIELLKKILMDNRRMISRIEFIKRDIILEDGLNYVFVGLRQAGKSFLMYHGCYLALLIMQPSLQRKKVPRNIISATTES